MLTRLELAEQTVVGVSVGGIYTSISVSQLNAMFDVGIAPRSFVGARNLFLSHGHADHVGALPAFLGIIGLAHQEPPTVFVPAEIESDLKAGLAAFNRGQRRQLVPQFVAVEPGDVHPLQGDLYVRGFRTEHTIPSLGYELFRRVQKLRPDFSGMAAEEIVERRGRGEALFDVIERSELVYATDTLIDVLDAHPRFYKARTLILECTFLDEKKTPTEARRKGHIHLDEIIQRQDLFKNQNLVLMHFSQLYRPSEVHHIMKQRLPSGLAQRVRLLAPQHGAWPG